MKIQLLTMHNIRLVTEVTTFHRNRITRR